jgi:hypothetical protein
VRLELKSLAGEIESGCRVTRRSIRELSTAGAWWRCWRAGSAVVAKGGGLVARLGAWRAVDASDIVESSSAGLGPGTTSGWRPGVVVRRVRALRWASWRWCWVARVVAWALGVVGRQAWAKLG